MSTLNPVHVSTHMLCQVVNFEVESLRSELELLKIEHTAKSAQHDGALVELTRVRTKLTAALKQQLLKGDGDDMIKASLGDAEGERELLDCENERLMAKVTATFFGKRIYCQHAHTTFDTRVDSCMSTCWVAKVSELQKEMSQLRQKHLAEMQELRQISSTACL